MRPSAAFRNVLLAMASQLSVRAGAAQVAPAGPVAGPSFMSARSASAGALTFYGGYRAGPVLAFVGLVQNPRTEYREAIVGLGRTFSRDATTSMLVGLAVAGASDGTYGQVYLLPQLTFGSFLVDGTIGGYLPIGSRGAAQLSATPLNVIYRSGSRLGVGASFVNSLQRGVLPSQALGPSVRLGIPHGTLALDFLRGLGAGRNDLRLTAQVSY